MPGKSRPTGTVLPNSLPAGAGRIESFVPPCCRNAAADITLSLARPAIGPPPSPCPWLRRLMPPNVTLVSDVPPLPPRPRDGHKGTFGTVAVVAGSRGMSGAAVLCGLGALRGGAGIVRLAVPQGIQPIVAAGNPCYLTAGLAEDAAGRLSAAARDALLELLGGADVAVLGPGLGQSADVAALLAAVLDAETPLVLDADALNNLRDRADRLGRRKGAVVVTPHPGEFARL